MKLNKKIFKLNKINIGLIILCLGLIAYNFFNIKEGVDATTIRTQADIAIQNINQAAAVDISANAIFDNAQAEKTMIDAASNVVSSNYKNSLATVTAADLAFSQAIRPGNKALRLSAFTTSQSNIHLKNNDKCLDIINDGTNNTPQMLGCANFSGQQWNILPTSTFSSDYTFQAQNNFSNKTLCLDMINNKLIMNKCDSTSPGQLWSTSVATPNLFNIQNKNMLTNNQCLTGVGVVKCDSTLNNMLWSKY
jgi:hypothetical protein